MLLKESRVGGAAGTDGIVAEMMKAAGEPAITILYHICNGIWQTGKWPDDWIYIPIYKKSPKDICQNYRTIALINQASKVMLYILQERLKSYLLPQIPPEQARFMPERKTRDQLLNIRQMIEKFYEYNVPAMICFLDSTAFDNVKWDHLWNILEEMAVHQHMIYLIRTLYHVNRAFVQIDNDLSQVFIVGKEVRQGCILSPILFNIYGEWIIRTAKGWEGEVSIGRRKISNLRYADDTAILATTEDEMAKLLGRIEDTSARVDLKLNRGKCCLMIIDKAGFLPQRFTRIRDTEKKDEVIYLEAKITSNGKHKGEIRRRIGMAKSALTRLSRI